MLAHILASDSCKFMQQVMHTMHFIRLHWWYTFLCSTNTILVFILCCNSPVGVCMHVHALQKCPLQILCGWPSLFGVLCHNHSSELVKFTQVLEFFHAVLHSYNYRIVWSVNSSTVTASAIEADSKL